LTANFSCFIKQKKSEEKSSDHDYNKRLLFLKGLMAKKPNDYLETNRIYQAYL